MHLSGAMVCVQGVADVSGFDGFKDWQHGFTASRGSRDPGESSEIPDNATEALHQNVRDKVQGSWICHGSLEPTRSHHLI